MPETHMSSEPSRLRHWDKQRGDEPHQYDCERDQHHQPRFEFKRIPEPHDQTAAVAFYPWNLVAANALAVRSGHLHHLDRMPALKRRKQVSRFVDRPQWQDVHNTEQRVKEDVRPGSDCTGDRRPCTE